MSPITRLILIFRALCFIVLLVYMLVAWGYYRGDRKAPPQKKFKPKTEETE